MLVIRFDLFCCNFSWCFLIVMGPPDVTSVFSSMEIEFVSFSVLENMTKSSSLVFLLKSHITANSTICINEWALATIHTHKHKHKRLASFFRIWKIQQAQNTVRIHVFRIEKSVHIFDISVNWFHWALNFRLNYNWIISKG